jgi:hypothetical protein
MGPLAATIHLTQEAGETRVMVETVAETTGMRNSRMTITRLFRQGMRDQQ